MVNQLKKMIFDIVVIGGGPVGLTLVSGLVARHTHRPLRIALIDIRNIGEKYQDPRVLALSEGSRQILMPYAWPEIINPIQSIKVSITQQLGQTYLNRENTILPNLGCVTTYGALLEALDRHVLSISHLYQPTQNTNDRFTLLHDEENLSSKKIILFEATRALSYSRSSNSTFSNSTSSNSSHKKSEETIVVHCQSQNGDEINIKTKLLINAEGSLAITYKTTPTQTANHLLPESLNAHDLEKNNEITIHQDYEQSALVSRVKVSKPIQNEAYERFTKLGAIALLPIGELNLLCDSKNAHFSLSNYLDNHDPAFCLHSNSADYALVWCNSARVNQQLLAMSQKHFLDKLQNEFGSSLGLFTKMSKPNTFDLRLIIKPIRADNHVVRIGNAAQTLHPIAGQGLNLGLRDAQLLINAIAHFGATDKALDKYVCSRQSDRKEVIALTDFLANGFTYRGFNLSPFCGPAFSIINYFPFLKAKFARQMIFGSRR